MGAGTPSTQVRVAGPETKGVEGPGRWVMEGRGDSGSLGVPVRGHAGHRAPGGAGLPRTWLRKRCRKVLSACGRKGHKARLQLGHGGVPGFTDSASPEEGAPAAAAPRRARIPGSPRAGGWPGTMGTAWKVSGSGGTAGTWQTEHGRHQGDRAVRTAPGVGTAGRRCSPRPEGLVFWMETAHNKTPCGGRDAEEKMRGSYVPLEQHPGGTLGDAGPSFPKPGSVSSRGPRKLSEGQSGLRWLGCEAGPQRLGAMLRSEVQGPGEAPTGCLGEPVGAEEIAGPGGRGSGLDPPAAGMESEGRCFGVRFAGEAGRTGDRGPCWEGCGGGRGRARPWRLARSWGGAAGDGAAAQQGLSGRGRVGEALGSRAHGGLFRAWQPRRGGPSC